MSSLAVFSGFWKKTSIFIQTSQPAQGSLDGVSDIV